jgi:hypothetical protein
VKRFFDWTFRPFFVLTGAVTALGTLNAFWPRWGTETLVKISFIPEYTIILQHWGFMLGLTGILMIVAALREDWRQPVLVFCTCEKAFLVYLEVANAGQPYSQGLRLGACMDATVVVYTLAYWAAYQIESRGQSKPATA